MKAVKRGATQPNGKHVQLPPYQTHTTSFQFSAFNVTNAHVEVGESCAVSCTHPCVWRLPFRHSHSPYHSLDSSYVLNCVHRAHAWRRRYLHALQHTVLGSHHWLRLLHSSRCTALAYAARVWTRGDGGRRGVRGGHTMFGYRPCSIKS